MKKLAWLTDIHLDFLDLEKIQDFAYSARASNPDAYLLGGDISVAPLLHTHLRILEHYWQRPIYFVLGNHDYYKGSINTIRDKLPVFVSKQSHLHWLPNDGIVELCPTTALIGHGLWADGRLGLKEKSSILLNDYALIKELKYTNQTRLFQSLNQLGDRAAREVEPTLRSALARYNHIFFLTHIPPFIHNHDDDNHQPDPDFLPHLICHAVGQMLRQVMAEFPHNMLTVLSGHIHVAFESWVSDNIFFKTAQARYRHPKMHEIITIEPAV